jgi:hypothetical protein
VENAKLSFQVIKECSGPDCARIAFGRFLTEVPAFPQFAALEAVFGHFVVCDRKNYEALQGINGIAELPIFLLLTVDDESPQNPLPNVRELRYRTGKKDNQETDYFLGEQHGTNPLNDLRFRFGQMILNELTKNEAPPTPMSSQVG